MAEGARLESVYTATYPGFESPPHRHIQERARTKVRAFFSHVAQSGGDEKPGPGFDNWRQPVGQTVNAVSGLPAGRAKRVNPRLTAIFKKELVGKYELFSHFSCLSGSELKYYTLNPLLIKRNHQYSPLRPFFIPISQRILLSITYVTPTKKGQICSTEAQKKPVTPYWITDSDC